MEVETLVLGQPLLYVRVLVLKDWDAKIMVRGGRDQTAAATPEEDDGAQSGTKWSVFKQKV